MALLSSSPSTSPGGIYSEGVTKATKCACGFTLSYSGLPSTPVQSYRSEISCPVQKSQSFWHSGPAGGSCRDRRRQLRCGQAGIHLPSHSEGIKMTVRGSSNQHEPIPTKGIPREQLQDSSERLGICKSVPRTHRWAGVGVGGSRERQVRRRGSRWWSTSQVEGTQTVELTESLHMKWDSVCVWKSGQILPPSPSHPLPEPYVLQPLNLSPQF